MILRSGPGVRRVSIWRVNGDSSDQREDLLAVESPLEIRVGSGEVDSRSSDVIALTMRTPGDDIELALGYLYNEGVIGGTSEVLSSTCADGSVRIELVPGLAFDSRRLDRYTFASSACGVCGRKSLSAVDRGTPQKPERTVSAVVLKSLPAKMRTMQPAFQETGGLHAAALFDFVGDLLMLREDVGRHNAVDKLVGAGLLSGISLTDKILVVSGRAGYELVQKAVASGIPVLAAIGAPSSLALETAEEADVTLIGFLRDSRFNLYTGGWRLK